MKVDQSPKQGNKEHLLLLFLFKKAICSPCLFKSCSTPKLPIFYLLMPGTSEKWIPRSTQLRIP